MARRAVVAPLEAVVLVAAAARAAMLELAAALAQVAALEQAAWVATAVPVGRAFLRLRPSAPSTELFVASTEPVIRAKASAKRPTTGTTTVARNASTSTSTTQLEEIRLSTAPTPRARPPATRNL